MREQSPADNLICMFIIWNCLVNNFYEYMQAYEWLASDFSETVADSACSAYFSST